MEPLKRYKTLEEPSKLYETNTRPVLVRVSDDLNSYVVKHNNGLLPCTKLANELIAYYFLEIWNIKTPRAAIIDVVPNHVQKISSSSYQPRYFQIPCWGTKFFPESTEFLQFFDQVRYYEREKFHRPNDLLKIIIFDIWLCNDDRTANNPNVLLASTLNGFEFWAIDHEAIFNGNNLGSGLYSLNLYDTLLYHPAIKKLLGNTLMENQNLEILIQDAYVCIDQCLNNLSEILSLIPEEWEIDIKKFEQQLLGQLFEKHWVASLKQNFLSLVQELNR